MMHFPPHVSDFPPIFDQFLDFLENFKSFTFSRKNFPFSPAKISDDLFFSHRPQILDFPPASYILYMYFSPYFGHDAFMHHPMHVLDAPVWTRGKDGRKKTTNCSTAWACERKKKQRKTKEEMDGQC